MKYSDIKNKIGVSYTPDGLLKWYVFIPLGFIAVISAFLFLLEESYVSKGVMGIVTTISTVLGIAIVGLSIWTIHRRSKIKGYCVNYMMQCKKQAAANNYSVCPRCGGALEEKTGREGVSHSGSTDTVTYRNGREVSRSNNSYIVMEDYTYYQCSNHSCNIVLRPDDSQGKHEPHFKCMPATVKSACTLIFGGDNYNNSLLLNNEPVLSNPKKILRVIGIAVAVIILLFFGYKYYDYSSLEDSLISEYKITKSISSDGAVLLNNIRKMDDKKAWWSLRISEQPKGYFQNAFSFSDNQFVMSYWNEKGEDVYSFEFDGYDFSSDLTGKYYLTKVDGKLSIIDYKNDVIYSQGCEFFNKNYKILQKLTYDNLLNDVLKKTAGGKYGENENYNTEVVKGNDAAVSISENGNNVRMFIEEENNRLFYTVSYADKNTSSLPNLKGYTKSK